MALSSGSPPASQLSSQPNSEADTAFTSAHIIAELISMFRIANGNQPAMVRRLRRCLADGREDIIEVKLYQRNAKLALACLKRLGLLMAKNGPGPMRQDALDEKQQVEAFELLRTYQDGSHPSCAFGKESANPNPNLRDAPKEFRS